MSVRLERNPQVAWRRVAGRTFIVSPEAGRLVLLNDVGARVWDLIDGERSVADIVSALCTEYRTYPPDASENHPGSPLAEGEVLREVQSFVGTLQDRGLAVARPDLGEAATAKETT